MEAQVIEEPDVVISIRNVTTRWIMPSNKEATLSSEEKKNKSPTLIELNIDFPKHKLIGVIGNVGAGKSSLLQVILGELAIESGSIDIHGSISYANQESWVFAASIRQNILFGEEYDRHRYNVVVQSCALLRDFEQFEKGDLTIVGERGTSLSGGQKARIK